MSSVSRSRSARTVWFVAGWICVAAGGVGVVLPLIPTTGPFIMAAACFSRSSPRFERWVLNLPGIGKMVQDFRDGLGMPMRAKIVAIGTMWVAIIVSSMTLGPVWLVAVAAALGGIGTYYIGVRVPTREKILASKPPCTGEEA